MPLQITCKYTQALPPLCTQTTHTINVATLPGLTLPPCRVKKTSSQPFIPSSVFHFPILLFTHSSSLSLILSLSFFCSRPYFQPAWLTAAPWRLQSEGPFVGTAFGGIKKGASTPSPPLLLSLPPTVHSTALSSSRPHCLESE